MHGLITWFARNPVAANLLMVFLIVWGLVTLATRLPLEVFPSFELDTVVIDVPFRGATPDEVEQGVTIRIEEAIQDLPGIDRIASSANEGFASISVDVAPDRDPRQVLSDIEQRVAGVSSLPAEADRPSVRIPDIDNEVISVIVSGSMPERELRQVAARVRDEIEALPSVSQVRLSGARDFELAIEIDPLTLQRYGLTLDSVARAIENDSLDLAAGAVRSAGGEVLLRTRGQAYGAEDYAAVVVLARQDGTRITLGDVARIRDGFEENELDQRWNGQRAIEIDVFRSGLQSAITVADDVKDYLVEAQSLMPHGVTLGYWRDWSRVVKARLNTLLDSALQGGLLIVVLLTLFLRFWVAAWVFVGVPVSILGGIALMPIFGVSLNMLSLFAFILVLGIVVDDAIVTGENIYTHMRRAPGDPASRRLAAIAGTQEVAVPVTFGVLTTVAAFSPLLMIDGARGQLFAQIPLIVIPVLLFSIVESKFVLPSHMSHLNFHKNARPNLFARLQHRIADGFEQFVLRVYQPMLAVALARRYLTLSLFIATAILVFSLVMAGHVRFVFFPRVQAETARATLEMPRGTPFETTRAHIERMAEAARELQRRHVDPETGVSVVEGIMTTAGSSGWSGSGTHLGRVMVEISPPEERALAVTSAQIVEQWREMIGDVPGAERLSFLAEIGRSGSPLDIQASGNDLEELREVSAAIRAELMGYQGIVELSDSFEGGKQESRLELLPAGRQLGVTLSDIARQVRTAYLGTRVQSIQRARDEVDVVVRYPAARRDSLEALRTLMIRTADGRDVPLESVASITGGRALPAIQRVDRRRVVNVRAEVDKETADIEAIKADLRRFTGELQLRYPEVRFSLEGEAREQRESFASLKTGLLFVLLVIYTLLAIPFKSYLQPLLVMVVIPFGIVGGILGHIVMGMPLSIMSYMGMLALCGVVVNDSLVLVDWVNRQRAAGVPMVEAVRTSGVARFRAVILTSLTTFFGLLPLIFESSTQAQFLIPMAVSLGYGILFATLVTLVLIPVNYLVLEDLRAVGRRAVRAAFTPRPAAASQAPASPAGPEPRPADP